MSLRWVRLKKFCELSGDTPAAARARLKDGHWLRDIDAQRPAGSKELWVNLETVNDWAERRRPVTDHSNHDLTRRISAPFGPTTMVGQGRNEEMSQVRNSASLGTRQRPPRKPRIRRLGVRDAPALLHLRRASADDDSSAEPEDVRAEQRALTLHEVRRDILSEHVFGAFVDGQLVGTASTQVLFDAVSDQMTRWSGFEPELVFAVRAVFVLRPARRQGIARALIARCLRHAKARGAASVVLNVKVANMDAQALYVAEGFSAFDVTGDDTRMNKRLRGRRRAAKLRPGREFQ